MKLFLKNTILFFTLIASILIYDNYVDIKYFYNTPNALLPAKKITNSYPLNEKLRFLNNANPVEILAIGSSITVNNLSSHTVTNFLNTKSYKNVGSYGFSIAHCSAVMETFVEIYKPSTVIICSNLEDFKLNYITFQSNAIKEAILNHKEITLDDLIFDKYYKRHLRGVKFDLLNNTHNGSLKFDSHGGVPFSFNEFKVDSTLWKRKPDHNAVVDVSYKKFESLSNYLASKSITLIFIHTPIREYLQDEEYLYNMSTHLKKIEDIIIKNNQVLVDLSIMKYPDSFFIDFHHLNSVGADSLTAQAFRIISSKLELD